MPKKGEKQPYKVAFTYSASVNAEAGRPAKDVSGTRPFSSEEDACRDAQDLAKRGASVTVNKVTGDISRRLARYEPWTDAQRRLAELADEIIELQDYEGPDQVQRMFALRKEMQELITNIGVTRY